MKVAIITARGGSKRIPRKNIRNFCGKPIIAYSIAAAQSAGCFDEVMISTDDHEIAEVAKKYGAKVPFMRSADTASDFATTAEVLFEVFQEYEKRGIHPECICCIYPTAPFVTAGSLKKAHDILQSDEKINAVYPIVRFSFPIQRAVYLEDGGTVAMFQPEHLLTRSQDLEPAYHDAGQFYWLKTGEFAKQPSLMPVGTYGMILPEWEVQDIDNEDDWVLAEMKYRLIQESHNT